MVASIRGGNPKTWAIELSTRANSRTTSKVSDQRASSPPNCPGMLSDNRPLLRSLSRSALGVPPWASRSTAVRANSLASSRAISSGALRALSNVTVTGITFSLGLNSQRRPSQVRCASDDGQRSVPSGQKRYCSQLLLGGDHRQFGDPGLLDRGHGRRHFAVIGAGDGLDREGR